MYNKLFTQILDSSIWLESAHIRLVWITFIAVMDQDGIVRLSSIGNVANRARVTDEQAKEAIDCLESADLRNPDQDHEGKRIERIPGVGWFVINAEKYREIIKAEQNREATRIRVAAHRALTKVVIEQVFCGCCNKKFEAPYSKYVVLDHNHVTGAVRDYICKSCNKNVELVENGQNCLNVEKLAFVNAYLAKHANVTNVTKVYDPVLKSFTSDSNSNSDSDLRDLSLPGGRFARSEPRGQLSDEMQIKIDETITWLQNRKSMRHLPPQEYYALFVELDKFGVFKEFEEYYMWLESQEWVKGVIGVPLMQSAQTVEQYLARNNSDKKQRSMKSNGRGSNMSEYLRELESAS